MIMTTIKVGGTTISLENINITNYICDFGNVVVGGSKKKSFRLTNVGKIPISFNFDKKLLGQAGIAIEPDKCQKISPNHSCLFNVNYTTRKTSKYGRTRYQIPIDIKNGPTYTIDFVANLTIPELSMSTDTLDFDRVLINTRKTVKIRLENLREVACEWWFYNPSPAGASSAATPDKKKEIEFFSVFPLSGQLLPGQRQTIDVMFIPNADKPFLHKLLFKCKDNTKQFVLNVKG
jgi:hydrocephalus-inducing protein